MTRKAEKYLTLWKTLRKIFLVLTRHITWFIWLGWNSLLLFFQEFESMIFFKAWFEIPTNSSQGGIFSSLAFSAVIKQTYLFKNLNVQSFAFGTTLMGQFWIWSENLQIRPKCTFIDVFLFFVFKKTSGLWNLYLEVDIKAKWS